MAAGAPIVKGGAKNLLAAYGWVEALIGIAALVFHPVFVSVTQASLEHVIPALGSPDTVELYKYSVCALLILPQTVLLGNLSRIYGVAGKSDTLRGNNYHGKYGFILD